MASADFAAGGCRKRLLENNNNNNNKEADTPELTQPESKLGENSLKKEGLVEDAKVAFEEAVDIATPAKRARRDAWEVRSGDRASGILNPVRDIMDKLAGKENPRKRLITLAQGDPSAYPHLRPSENQVQAVMEVIAGGAANGYQPSQGNIKARAALAETFTVRGRPALTPNDVFMTWGCSEALAHAIAALATKGSNILLPRPGFCMYEVLCNYHEVEIRFYDLNPDKNWEVDIEQLKTLADDKTVAMLINNPNNPCGAVYSAEHLTDVLRAAEELKLPIIADEVYMGITFGPDFVPCTKVNNKVPILTVCSVSKRWLAPGWRLGWVTVHDCDGILAAAKVPQTLLKLCQISLGPSAPMQAALPAILGGTPQDWYNNINKELEASAKCCVRRIREIPGLEVNEPEGAMYCMVKILPGYFDEQVGGSDVDFAAQLLAEESVAMLPGQCFRARGFIRVVFAASVEVLEEAFDRLEAFCRRHSAKRQ
mmetsp:Transcript_50957/g.108225  ORF Transcript_50957/g.108225 Transcript_50957/m.108225 type:complete len:484 (-) Transcript_50957:421-1872(-)|eukprot:CAMPEP_0206445754 /NCGR_PEP_ID=MMETSP0324_2-20121206/15705_1 /ASSEMBLY_ACC=CAM_ASM_000836 /TAXON_ID=2866 /ORGANISM="Crypthecodinium cohnii, Strain Seligo" /LENGTH=483 /DNA_ID=CAMNT_0053914047 /DNA_START=140 /DNA_END=1591 /DNA_ORIENTATION=+